MSDKPEFEPNLEIKKYKLKKPKKPKINLPEEFLDGANSYDDKLVLVKVLTEKEKQRVVSLVKNMLKDTLENRNKPK